MWPWLARPVRPQNPHGKGPFGTHRLCPYDDPKIAICVYVENAGFGATYGVPIGSLMMEKYLNDSIAPERKYIEQRMFESNTIINSGVNETLTHHRCCAALDWPTVIIYVLLVLCGVVSIYAASYDFDNASMFSFDEFSGKQLRWVGPAFLAGAMIMLIDFRVYEAYAYPIYGVVILLLIVTIFIAPDIKGSRSWLVLGPMSLQPAEFGKFATALALAKLFSSYNFSLNASASNYLKALLIIFLPIFLILSSERDRLGTPPIWLCFVLYREGMSGFVLTPHSPP